MGTAIVRFRQGFEGIVSRGLALGPAGCWLLLGMVSGRAQLGGLAPFSVALAVLAPGLERKGFWPLLAGLLTGAAIRAGAVSLMTLLADLAAILVAAWLGWRLRQVKETAACLLPFSASGVCLAVKLPLCLASGGGTADLPGLVSEALLAGLLVIPGYYALPGVRFQHQRWLRLALLLIVLVCGLGDLSLGFLQLREVLVRFILLGAGAGWGAPAGAATGVVLGLLGGDFWQLLGRTGFYAGTGFFTGLFKGMGRWGAAAGFLLSGLFFSLFYAGGAELSGHLAASAVSLLLYLGLWPLLVKTAGLQNGNTGTSPVLAPELGFAQRPKPQEPVCGDSYGICRLSPERLLLAVSDGMGAGINAARESRLVVRLLEQLLGGGTPPEVAVEVVNTALYLRGGEESAATIDLALADLALKRLKFIKVGAPPGFIKREEQVEVIRSVCWPAGILDRVDAGVLEREILPGDLLVLVTDGVSEADRRGAVPGEWLYNYLQELLVEDPQGVADMILKKALQMAGAGNRDDMTVVVARFSGVV